MVAIQFINEGQKPFEYTTDKELTTKENREKARAANKRYYKLKGLRTKKRKPACPECGRRTGCKHRVSVWEEPKLINKQILCTNCQGTVIEGSAYCPHCAVYDPGKPRAHPQIEPKGIKKEKVEPEVKKEPKKKKTKKEKKANEPKDT